MTLFLVRHAKAGHRKNADGADDLRPLSRPGRIQAEGLVQTLGGQVTGPLLSSPFVRCVQTLEPLAAALGQGVETTPVLAEGSPFEKVLELMGTLPDGTVLCSHGDVIPAVIEALERRGVEVVGPLDWRKAATWVLERDGGTVTRATTLPPPQAPPGA